MIDPFLLIGGSSGVGPESTRRLPVQSRMVTRLSPGRKEWVTGRVVQVGDGLGNLGAR